MDSCVYKKNSQQTKSLFFFENVFTFAKYSCIAVENKSFQWLISCMKFIVWIEVNFENLFEMINQNVKYDFKTITSVNLKISQNKQLVLRDQWSCLQTKIFHWPNTWKTYNQIFWANSYLVNTNSMDWTE